MTEPKWIKLSERKPPGGPYCYAYYTDGIKVYHQDWIPHKASHWLEVEIPPLPKEEKPVDANDYYKGKRLPKEIIDCAGVCDELKEKPVDLELKEMYSMQRKNLEMQHKWLDKHGWRSCTVNEDDEEEKPVDPDWERLDIQFRNAIPGFKNNFWIDVYEFLRAKYGK